MEEDEFDGVMEEDEYDAGSDFCQVGFRLLVTRMGDGGR